VEAETLLILFRVIVGTAVIAFFAAWAARRAMFLINLARAATPNPARSFRKAAMGNLKLALVNIFGNRKLLRWTLPGIAHFWVMWSFFIVQTTLLEAAGELYIGPEFQLPLLNALSLGGITAYDLLGFFQDGFMLLSLIGIAIFAAIRISQHPQGIGRRSRFTGSNLNQGWWVLGLETLVVWTLLVAHGVRFAEGHAPTEAAFLSRQFGEAFAGMDTLTLEWVAAANLVAVSGLGQTQAAIAISGGQPGQTHGWHMRQGACGTQGPIVGMPEQYGALRPDSRGIANATATLEQELAMGQTYHVNVTVSPQDRGNIMACGNLRQQ
jgi:hypothetical protein